MRRPNVSEYTRLIQVFLSPAAAPNIFEVCTGDDGLSCTCPSYRARETCKHTRFVQARIDNNGGTYPLEISNRATTEDAGKAQQDAESFREFIIKFGKIEVY